MFVFILITCLLDIVLMLWGEILLWSLWELEVNTLPSLLPFRKRRSLRNIKIFLLYVDV